MYMNDTIKRVIIFGLALVVIVALNNLLNILAGFMPAFLFPLFSISVNLFIIGSVMYFVFKD